MAGLGAWFRNMIMGSGYRFEAGDTLYADPAKEWEEGKRGPYTIVAHTESRGRPAYQIDGPEGRDTFTAQTIHKHMRKVAFPPGSQIESHDGGGWAEGVQGPYAILDCVVENGRLAYVMTGPGHPDTVTAPVQDVEGNMRLVRSPAPAAPAGLAP